MIESDWPPMLGGDRGQRDPGQVQPPHDAAPLILSLAFAPDDQARLDRLRAAHFPPRRNFLAAHATLFHHLPGSNLLAIGADIEREAAIEPFGVRVAHLQSLGRGVALTLEAERLMRLRAKLARGWSGTLTVQDRQGYRPHVTIQNKVDPIVAKTLLARLSADFEPWDVTAIGLSLWHYRGGPWELASFYPFKAELEVPPELRHR